MVEDYSYEGVDFHNDLELDLPEGGVWDDRGKNDFMQISDLSTPAGMSPIARREGARDMMDYWSEAEEELGDLEENLQQLNVGIPDMTTDEVPKHY